MLCVVLYFYYRVLLQQSVFLYDTLKISTNINIIIYSRKERKGQKSQNNNSRTNKKYTAIRNLLEVLLNCSLYKNSQQLRDTCE